MTKLLREIYPGEVCRPVQSLDAATIGVLVFKKTKETATFLIHEFAGNRVHTEYFSIVEGRPRERHFVTDPGIGKKNGSRRGTGNKAVAPKQAITDFHWLASNNGRSLLKAVSRSARTNQIRVHLAEAGLPILNNSIYGRGSSRGAVSPLGLYAYRLVFRCFKTSLEITAPWPEYFQPFIKTKG